MYGFAEQVQILCDGGAKDCIDMKTPGLNHKTITAIQIIVNRI